jgi:hypothetical protein
MVGFELVQRRADALRFEWDAMYRQAFSKTGMRADMLCCSLATLIFLTDRFRRSSSRSLDRTNNASGRQKSSPEAL